MRDKIYPGDLFENPEGLASHCSPCTILVCSLNHKQLGCEKIPLWNTLELWWYKGGMRQRGDTYNLLTENELNQMEYFGNMYDAINKTYGEKTGTKAI